MADLCISSVNWSLRDCEELHGPTLRPFSGMVGSHTRAWQPPSSTLSMGLKRIKREAMQVGRISES